MSRNRRPLLIPILVMTASLVGLPIAPAQSTAPEPAEVTALRAGIGALAQVFLPEYGEVGPFAKPLPMTDTSAGAEVVRPGDALDLSTVLKQGITDKLIDLQTSSPASTVAEFLEQLDTELDGTVAGVDLPSGSRQECASTPPATASGWWPTRPVPPCREGGACGRRRVHLPGGRGRDRCR